MAIPVIEREGRPTVRLEAGQYLLQGKFQWQALPQRLAIPGQFGLLQLTVNGQEMPSANWDGQGDLWLQRQSEQDSGGEQLFVQVYRLLEDGIPMWLRTELELSVSGKSREVELGTILPEGWTLASVESPIPVAVDSQGILKAQVRAGKWSVLLHAFRTSAAERVRLADDALRITDEELIGFQSSPSVRTAELTGLVPIDVTQSTFPATGGMCQLSLEQ